MSVIHKIPRWDGVRWQDIYIYISSVIEIILDVQEILIRLVAGFPLRRPWFEPGSGHVGFVVNKVTLGQVFS
jgi:hypothetical protein